MATEVFIHKMSEHMATATIIRWLVKEGDPIEQYQVIMEVETDKVAADLEAPASGVLKGVRPGAIEGAVVTVGETIAFIAAPDEEVPVLPPLPVAGPEAGAEARSEPAGRATPLPIGAGEPPVRATPVARRVARELGLDVALVHGTGPDGRITEEDVRAFAESLESREGAAAPPIELAMESVPDEWLELTAAERVTGQRMLESARTAPQFSLELGADMTGVLALLEAGADKAPVEVGDRPSITAILVKAVADALRDHPRANASFENGRVKLYGHINIGVAVGGDAGLVVPVIKDADRKSLAQVAQEIRAFQYKAGQMRFGADDLEGGTFTISNLGMHGIERFNAIINPPQSAILAVGRVVKKPVGLDDGTVALRPMMSLALTVDHRAMDGIEGARFLVAIRARLEESLFSP